MNVNVIGAGISGIMTAYYLAKKGYQVTVYEKNRHPAMECSYANGGQISVCNSETWNNWPTVWKGVKWLAKKDAPLLIRPYPSFRKMAWMSGFLKHTMLGNSIRDTIETIKLGIESRAEYEKIIKEEKLKIHKADGMLHVFTKESDLNDALNIKELFNVHGCDWEVITPTKVKTLEPALYNFKDLIGGVYIRSDWSGDIHEFCFQMFEVLSYKYKVKFVFNTEIKDVRELNGPTVIANGHQLYEQAKKLGEFLNVYPVKGYSITINLKDSISLLDAPKTSLLDNNKKIVCSRFGDKFRVAGTAELADTNLDIRQDRIEPLLRWVSENFPTISTRSYSSWACLRPMNSNMMPIVRKSKTYDNIYYNGGHGHLGWTLGAITGKKVADLI